MTSYSTCSYVGCDCRIPYDPKTDKTRKRYCEYHEEAIRNRLYKLGVNENDIERDIISNVIRNKC
jgi:hypothetical protein